MGMAASQARLLMITARMHDIEFEAQRIQDAKVQLATQEDAVYEEYQKALDATTLTFASIDSSGVTSTQIANFNTLFSMNRLNPAKGQDYILIDSRGRVVVDDSVYDGYQNFLGQSCPQDAHSFAMYMLTGGDYPGDMIGSNDLLLNMIQDTFDELLNVDYGDESLSSLAVNVLQALGESGYPSTLASLIRDTSYLSPEVIPAYTTALNQMFNYFFKNYGQEIFNDSDIEDNYSKSDFDYYVKIFNAIQQHGGCIKISEFNGPDGSAANNSEWLTAMIQCGQMSIETINVDNQGNVSLTGTSVSSDTNLNFTPTTQIDKAALAAAEAKYEHELKIINRKDEKYDLDLKKLDTERNALDKQRESIEKVSKDNIERTFGIFS